MGDLRLVDGAPDDSWTFSDGPVSADVFGSWDLQVELSILGEPPTSTNMHLRDGPDGVTWFTDCGEPLP